MTKDELLKGLNSLEELLNEQEQLRKDGLIFIFEKGYIKFNKDKKEYEMV